jgi:hypothetical protein
MLSRIFGSRSSSSSREPKRNANHQRLNSSENRKAEMDAMTGAVRELYSYDKPSQELGMTTLLEQHEEGTRFLYAAVVGKEEEDYDSRLRKLLAFKPKLNKVVIPFSDIPSMKLFKESEVFPIQPLIASMMGKKKQLGEYFRLREAIVVYGAIVSPDCNFTRVTVGVMDQRLQTDQLVKSFIADTNKEARGDLKLSYCIPVENADLVSLVVSREQQFLIDDLQWGAIKVQLSIEFMDFPRQYDNLDVTAVNMITGTTLGDRVTNPDTINVSIMDNDRKRMTVLYQSGDLVDEDVPIKNKRTMAKSSKSTIREAPKGDNKHFGEGWGDMSIPRMDRYDESIEPSDDGSVESIGINKERLIEQHKREQVVLRSAMKKKMIPVQEENDSEDDMDTKPENADKKSVNFNIFD